VHRLARVLATGRPALDPVARDTAGQAYAQRPADPFQPPTPATPPATRRVGTSAGQAPASGQRPGTSRQAGRDALDAARNAATEPLPELAATPLAELATPAGSAGPVDAADASMAEAITAVLADAGPAGVSLSEITTGVQRLRGAAHRGSVHRALRTLIDGGQARQSGTKNRYRYHPNPAATHPESHAA